MNNQAPPPVSASRRPILWMAAASLALTLLLYGRALALPSYMDDVVHLNVVDTHTLGELLTSSAGMPYYRPLNLIPWKVLGLLVGSYPAAVIHAVNLIGHALDGWLLGLLARQIFPEKRLTPWLAMALYLAFPFSYQAVPWGASFCHILIAGGAILTVLLAARWWKSGRWPALALAWLVAALAPFGHETGVILGGLLAGCLVIACWPPGGFKIPANWRRLALAVLPVLALNGAFALIWAAMPKNRVNTPTGLDDFLANGLYFGQGLTYPLTQFGGLLSRLIGQPKLAAGLLMISGLLILGTALWLARDRRAWLGLWWFGATALPPILFLPGVYVFNSPRLMVTASAGAALAWAVGIEALRARLPRFGRPAAVMLGALLLLGGGVYVTTQMNLHDQLAPLYREVFDAATAGERHVIFNLPAWIALRAPFYAVGNDGITYLTDYFPFRDLIRVNTGVEVEAEVLVWPDITPVLPAYTLGMEGEQTDRAGRAAAIQDADRAWLVRALDGYWAWERGAPITDDRLADAAAFANGVRLRVEAVRTPGAQHVEVRLAWQVEAPVAEVAFVHLVCGDVLTAQRDGPPLGGLYPFDLWPPGQRWGETRLIALPPDTAESCVVNVGLYNPETGVRVPLEDGGEFVTAAVQR